LASTPRPPDSAAHSTARRYILDHMRRAGFDADETPRVANLLTRPLPDRADLPLIIIGAHYDSIPTSPGADDNASAVAALLEVAAWLRPQLDGADKWATARLQLAAYDLEEYGMIGSTDHAGSIQGTVRCMISLEMLGFTDKRPGGQK